MGHHQPETIATTDKTMAHGVITNTMIAKASKAMDIWLNWLKCCQALQQFDFQWKQGSANVADYKTKHHPFMHHKKIFSTYVLDHIAPFLITPMCPPPVRVC